MASDGSGVPFVHWGGVAFCLGAGLFNLAATVAHHHAKELNSAVKLDSLSELRNMVGVVPLLVAVTGRAWTDSPLSCENSPKAAVLTEYVEEEVQMKQNQSGDWTRSSIPLRSVVREAPWYMEDGGPIKLPVIGGKHANITYPETGECLVEPKTPLIRRVGDTIMGIKVLHIKQTERLLPVGSALTAIGELASVGEPATSSGAGLYPAAQRASGHQVLVLKRPENGGPFIISTKSVAEIVAEMDTVSNGLKWFAYGLGAAGAVLVVRQLVKGTMAYLRHRQLKRRIDDAHKRLAEERQRRNAQSGGNVATAGATAGGEDGQDADRRQNLCVVCLERDCDMVFSQCGHMCVCSGCGQHLNRCPICRARTNAIRVYQV